MNATVSMIMLISKITRLSEYAVLSCALFYNSGRWNYVVTPPEVDQAYGAYKRNETSQAIEDFCLDLLSRRLPQESFDDALEQQRRIAA